MTTPYNSIPGDLVAKELRPQEELLWSGQPRQGFFLRPQDLYLIPFSIMWGGFAIFWESLALMHAMSSSPEKSAGAWFTVLWGVPFVLVGLMMLIGRFFVDIRLRANTYYGVTDQRVLILSGIFARATSSVSLLSLSEITLVERRNGTGDVRLGILSSEGTYSPPYWPGAARHLPPTLEYISTPRDVYQLIQDHAHNHL